MSSPTHVAVLVNPHARSGRGAHLGAEIVTLLRERGIVVDVLVGDDATHARELARAATGHVEGLVVVGGDGTIRLALSATLGTGVPLAVIPAGTGNDVARNLDIPLGDPPAAIEVLLAGHRRAVDVGRVSFPDGGTELFLTVAATGFDAAVTARAIGMSWPRGQARYTVAAMAELVGLRGHHYQVRVDDDHVEGDLVFVAIGNSASYGGGMLITPRASLSDGLLDVTMAALPGRLPRATLARVFPRVFSGSHVSHPMVRTARAREIELYSDPPALVSLDGDVVGTLPAIFEVVPAAIEVFTPAP